MTNWRGTRHGCRCLLSADCCLGDQFGQNIAQSGFVPLLVENRHPLESALQLCLRAACNFPDVDPGVTGLRHIFFTDHQFLKQLFARPQTSEDNVDIFEGAQTR